MGNSTNAVKTGEKTNWKLGTYFALGEVGSNLSWYMINTYLTIFYTDVVGLSASAISAIMLIARIWDAINDPMMGSIADRTKTRWGKFRPYILFAPPVLAIFNILTFTVFPVKGVTKVILCLIFYIGAGMAYTAVNIPYNALVNVIARSSEVRMNLISCKAVGSGVVSMVLSAVVMPMILFFGKSNMPNARGYFWTTVCCTVVMLPCFWLCGIKCKETVHVDAPEVEGTKKSPFKSLAVLLKNKYL